MAIDVTGKQTRKLFRLTTYNSDYRDSISLSMTLFPSMANFAYLYVYIGHRSGCLTEKNENRCNRVRGGKKMKTLVNPERRREKALLCEKTFLSKTRFQTVFSAPGKRSRALSSELLHKTLGRLLSDRQVQCLTSLTIPRRAG